MERLFTIILVAALSLGGARCAMSTMTPKAEVSEISLQDLPSAPQRADSLPLRIDRFITSNLVSLDPAIALSREELAELARQEFVRQISNAPQFALLDEGAPVERAAISLRGEVTTLFVGPELRLQDQGVFGVQEGSGEAQQTRTYRPVKCSIQVDIIDHRAGASRRAGSALGSAETNIVLTYTESAQGQYQDGSGSGTGAGAVGGSISNTSRSCSPLPPMTRRSRSPRSPTNG